MNDVLFTLADLSTVWVMANVPESDFAAPARRCGGGTIRLTATAYPGRTFEARLLSIGADGRPDHADRPTCSPRPPTPTACSSSACSSGSCSTRATTERRP